MAANCIYSYYNKFHEWTEYHFFKKRCRLPVNITGRLWGRYTFVQITSWTTQLLRPIHFSNNKAKKMSRSCSHLVRHIYTFPLWLIHLVICSIHTSKIKKGIWGSSKLPLGQRSWDHMTLGVGPPTPPSLMPLVGAT